jgi:hypothetical protein
MRCCRGGRVACDSCETSRASAAAELVGIKRYGRLLRDLKHRARDDDDDDDDDDEDDEVAAAAETTEEEVHGMRGVVFMLLGRRLTAVSILDEPCADWQDREVVS